MTKKYITILTFIAVGLSAALIWGGIWSVKKTAEKTNPKMDSFAQCLTEKKITMYGADWCPHCQNEKKAFGNSWKYISYIECPKNPKLCLNNGVDGYPTWILPDGKKLIGEQGLEKLSQESGCAL